MKLRWEQFEHFLGHYAFSLKARICTETGFAQFLGKRSKAYSHKDTSKYFVFPVRDIPLRFISLKCSFLCTHWSYLSDFCINTTRGSRIIIFQIFAGRKFFWRVISDKNFNFRIFRGQRIYFWDLSVQEAWKCWCLCINRWNTIQLSEGLWCFLPHFFLASFRWKKRKFFETDSTFPMAHCVS